MAKSMQSMSIMEQNPGMKFFCTYVLSTVVAAVVIYLANMFFPMGVVLGTVNIPLFWAIGLSAGKLGLITTFASAFFNEWEFRSGKMLSPGALFAGYFVVILGEMWFLSRYAEIFGMGVSSWMVLVSLAAVVDVAMGVVMMTWQGMMDQNKR